MKRALRACLLVLMCFAVAAAEEPLANEGRKGLQAKSIDEVLALPDEEIDIGMAALLIGREYDPTFDAARYVVRLDQTALELRDRIGGESDPEKIVAIINDYLFTESGYVALREGEYEPVHGFLHVLLDHKRGQCSSLSTLYLAVAERLGLPCFAVAVPRHVFVRYVADEASINIETTDRGARWSDEDYAHRLRVPETPAAGSFHMRNLTKRQFLADLLTVPAATYSKTGRLAQAARAYRRAAAICPGRAETWYSLGAVYCEQGRLKEAIQACTQALTINPNSGEAWSNLGSAYARQGKWTQALRAYRNAVEINPRLHQAWSSLGKTFLARGRLGDAADAFYTVGCLRAEQQKYDESVAVLKKALTLSPDHADAWCALGSVYVRQERYGKSFEALKRAVALDPDNPEAAYLLAVVCVRRGEYALAWQHMHKYQDLGGEPDAKLLKLLRTKMQEPPR